jgi:hypothetical protein
MRTTICLPDDLLLEAKTAAARSRRTLTSLIEEALRESLAHRSKKQKPEPVSLTTYGSKGVLPGVDLDDTSALLDLMEERDDPGRR